MNNKAKSLKSDRSQDEKIKFRGQLGKRSFSLLNKDKNFEYRWVITTYESNVDAYERVEEFIDGGWSVVYDENRPEDERANVPDNDKENSERLKPVTKKLRGGHMAVLMKCSKEQRQLNEKKKCCT